MSRFTDAKSWERCQWTITLSDKTTAQCGRRKRPDGPFCTQHENIAAEQRGAVDVRVENEGTIVLFRPVSVAGREWIDANVQSEAYQWFGGGLCVEHRYASDLVEGMKADGLTLAGRDA